VGVSYFVIRPIRRLERATGEIAKGRYNLRLPAHGNDELARLAGAFNQMAQSIDDSIKVEKTLNSQLTVLNTTASELASSFDPGYLMDRLADGVCRLVTADAAVVYLVDPETLRIQQVTTRQMEVNPDGQGGHIYEKGLFGLAAKACQGLLIEEAGSHPDATSTPGYRPPFGAVLTLPLLSGDRLLGVLVVGRTVGAEPFGLSDLDVARGLVMFGTTAIEKALLYQHSQLLASTDGLTGLYNHREFQQRLSVESERSQRYGHSLSLLLVDIDHFKRVNDQHGHPAGDTLLKELAETIRTSIRTMDVAARYGGEEFVVILPETPSEGAVVVAERLRRQIADRRVVAVSGQSLTCSVSIGVATYPVDAQQKERLIDAADKALYHAKYAGRNTVKTHQQFLQTDFTAESARRQAQA
jgi:diguanylate cyclase (GGDEF)-like protein